MDMRSTRRLLDRWPPAALTLLACAAAAVASTASCSSEHDAGFELDAGVDAPFDSEPGVDGEADAVSKPDDGGPFDGGLAPITCDSSPCAVALVTTTDEGFCALLQDGTVACWGANDVGQLGRGEISVGSADAERVIGLADIVELDRTCAVDKAGAAYCWGKGPFHAGDFATTTTATPVKLDIPPVKRVSAYGETACALGDSGVLCWGSNVNGQVAAYDGSAEPYPPTPIALRAGAPIRTITINETAFAIREDGTTESWGANLLLARQSPLSPDPHPLPAGFGPIDTVDVAERRACVASRGDAFCWGEDVGPELRRTVMTEPVVQISTTKVVHAGTQWVPKIKPARWCALTGDGAVYCQGENGLGQAGDGTFDHATRPVQVRGLPAPAARVKTTWEATCILLVDGKVYCVGNNYYGQLGNGILRRPSLEPVQVSLP
jgi:alpha-tubulin suppressor-like RCC1 family protein